MMHSFSALNSVSWKTSQAGGARYSTELEWMCSVACAPGRHSEAARQAPGAITRGWARAGVCLSVGRAVLAAAFELETRLQRALLGSPNQLEAVFANFEKRVPSFAEVE